MQQFTTDDQEKIRQWLAARIGENMRCFLCGSNQWSLLPAAAMTSMFDTHTGRIHYMDGYPLVGLVCTGCAHVVWFSAPVIGLQPEPAKSVEVPSQEGAADEPSAGSASRDVSTKQRPRRAARKRG